MSCFKQCKSVGICAVFHFTTRENGSMYNCKWSIFDERPYYVLPQRGCVFVHVRENSPERLLYEKTSSFREDVIGPFIKNAPLAIVHTAVLSRGEVKYGANAYRFALLEAGHMAQNIYLISTALGIGCCASGGTIADTITEALDLSDAEIPIYSLALGHPK